MSSVKKAEKSRVHAKQRRTDESKEICEIAHLLPLPSHVTKRLDKASILRLAITFLRLRDSLGKDTDAIDRLRSDIGEGGLMLESLSGFFIIVSADKEIIYVSDNVEKHIGLNQVDMLGKNIMDYVLEKDQTELNKQFQDKIQSQTVHGMGLSSSGSPIEMDMRYTSITNSLRESRECRRQFFLRMKCSYHKRSCSSVRTNSVLSASQVDYSLLQWTGYIHYDQDGGLGYLAAVVRPLQPTPIMELKMDGNMFISRHSLDLKFVYCDPRLSTMLGYEPDEIPGNSMYRYHHPGDLDMCGKCHSSLMTAGTNISKYYRFLNKSNEWCWLQTRATIVYNTSKCPQYIVCMNYIVSEKEGRRYLLEHLGETNISAGQNMTTAQMMSMSQMMSASQGLSDSPQLVAPREPISNISQPPVGAVNRNVQSPGTSYHPDSYVNPSSDKAPAGYASPYGGSPGGQVPVTYANPYASSPSTQTPAGYVSPHVTPPGNQAPVTYMSSPEYQPDVTYYNPTAGYENQAPLQYGSVGGAQPEIPFSNPPRGDVTSVYSYQAPAGYANVPTCHNTPLSDPQASGMTDVVSNMSGIHLTDGNPSYSEKQFAAPSEQQQQYVQEGSPPIVPQYPSPSGSYHADSPPTFYLPHQQSKPAELPADPGQMWLSLHTLADSHPQVPVDTLPSSLAEDIEDVTMEHCHHLMNQATKQVLDAQAIADYDNINGAKDDDAVQHWPNCEKLVEMQAAKALRKLRGSIGAEPPHRERSAPYRAGVGRGPTLKTTPSSLNIAGSLPPLSSNLLQSTERDIAQSQFFSLQNENEAGEGTSGCLPEMDSFGEMYNIVDMLQTMPEQTTETEPPPPASTTSPPLVLPSEPQEVHSSSTVSTDLSYNPSLMSFSSDMSLDRRSMVSTQSMRSLSSNQSQDALQNLVSLASEIEFSSQEMRYDDQS